MSCWLVFTISGNQFFVQYPEIKKISDQDVLAVSNFSLDGYKKCFIPNLGVFYLDDIEDIIKNRLKKNFSWEPDEVEIIKKYVKPATIVIDIGAHIGTHTFTMAKSVGSDGLVISFEPQKKIYSELVMNLKENGYTNVLPIRRAIGDSNKIVSLSDPQVGNEGGRFIGFGSSSETAEMITLDSLKLNSVSFIKIDVENLEEQVLDGAFKTIMRNRPFMLIEIRGNDGKAKQDNENTQEAFARVIKKIQGLGYVLKNVWWRDFLAIPQEYIK